MLITQSQDQIRAGFNVQTHCEQLKEVRLRRCVASLDLDGQELKPPFSLQVSHESDANHTPDGTLRVTVCFRVESADSSDPRKSLFSIECAFDLDYALQKAYDPQPEEIEAFKNGNAVFNCWPYAREFVQTMTRRMGLDAPPLPLLRIAPKQPPASAKVTEIPKVRTAKRRRRRKTT